METLKRCLRIELSSALLEQLRALDKTQRREIGRRVEEVQRTFGQPHVHHGAGIRDLGGKTYECRISLHQRLVFVVIEGCLYFHFLGNHNDVERFLRNK